MAVHGCTVKRERGRRASFREQRLVASEERTKRRIVPREIEPDLDRQFLDRLFLIGRPSGDVPTLINLTDCADYRLALFRKFSWLIIRFSFPNILNTSIRARDRFKFNKEYNFLYQLLIFFPSIIRYFTCLVNDLYEYIRILLLFFFTL